MKSANKALLPVSIFLALNSAMVLGQEDELDITITVIQDGEQPAGFVQRLELPPPENFLPPEEVTAEQAIQGNELADEGTQTATTAVIDNISIEGAAGSSTQAAGNIPDQVVEILDGELPLNRDLSDAVDNTTGEIDDALDTVTDTGDDLIDQGGDIVDNVGDTDVEVPDDVGDVNDDLVDGADDVADTVDGSTDDLADDVADGNTDVADDLGNELDSAGEDLVEDDGSELAGQLPDTGNLTQDL